MATAAQLKSLLRSYSEADGERFLAVATQIAAHAARSGKTRLATELKELLDEIKQKQATARIGGAVPIARPKGELLSVLSVTYPQTRLSAVVLGKVQTDLLHRVLHEYRQQSKLRSHGLSARRKLLLAGPPGGSPSESI